MNLLERRRALMARVQSGGRLPEEYQEVEWIGCSGSQKFNSGISTDDSTRVIFRCKDVNVSIEQPFFGIELSNPRRVFSFTRIGAGKLRYMYGKYYNANIPLEELDDKDVTVSTDGRYISFYDNNAKTQNTYYCSASSSGSSETTDGLGVFGCATGTGAFARAGFVGKTLNVSAYNNGSKVLDLIPCYRKSDDEPGMYDLVSGTFFTNAGTGAFTVGPDIN